LPPKHDAGTATRHYRAFLQRRCRAAAAGAVLKPQGGNCAVLPKIKRNGAVPRTLWGTAPFFVWRWDRRDGPGMWWWGKRRVL